MSHNSLFVEDSAAGISVLPVVQFYQATWIFMQEIGYETVVATTSTHAHTHIQKCTCSQTPRQTLTLTCAIANEHTNASTQAQICPQAQPDAYAHEEAQPLPTR